MKNIEHAVIVGVFLFFAPAIPSFAIEGLQLSVQSSNVVLSWPSDYDSGETYLVQYRQTLNAADAWQTLADYLPADYGTNLTFFIHSNIVEYPPAGAGGGTNGGNISPNLPNQMSGVSPESAPMVTPTDGSGAAVPLALYPPGIDLSGFTIFDPVTGESVSGNGYVMSSSLITSKRSDGIQPMGADEENGDTNQYTGFYRVVRDGAHLFGLTNGAVLSGIVTIPVELANDGGNVSSVSITEDDTPVGDSIQTAPQIAPLTTTLNTTLLSNGVHTISASARWDDTNGGLWEAESPAISVTISNEISFENWMPTFGETGNTFLFRATSAHTNTDWTVSVYDSNDTYLGYFSGHTYDGDISFYYDYSGTSLTNNPVFSFEIATEYVDPPTPKTYKQTDPWTAEGAWAMATQHAWDSASDSDTLYQELSGFVGVAGSLGGVSPAQSSDGSPYALAFGSSNPAGDSNWSAFRNAIFNSTTRNLVYFGHGGQTGIGYNPANTNRYISSTEIANRLHTIPAGQTNRHAFRFVFIDACSTALGAMPESFGILHRENVPGSDYVDASMRYSAYVGWPKNKYIGILNGAYINYDHVNFIVHIQTEMILNGRTIKDAIVHASQYADTHDSFGPDDLKVFGYGDLTVGAYNN